MDPVASELDEARACAAFATFVNRLAPEALVPLLAGEVAWESQNVLAPLLGREAVAKHIIGKAATWRGIRPGIPIHAELGRCRGYPGRPCVLVYQGEGFVARRPEALVLLTVDGGQVQRVDLCSVAPSPESAERLGVFSGLVRAGWPGEPANDSTPEPWSFKSDLALETILRSDNVCLDVDASDVTEALLVASRNLAANEPVEWFHVFDRLLERTRILAVGRDGYALPHDEVRGLTRTTACLIRTRAPLDFGDPEGPTRIMMALVGPSFGPLQRAMLLVSRVLGQPAVRTGLLEATRHAEAYGFLREAAAPWATLDALRKDRR